MKLEFKLSTVEFLEMMDSFLKENYKINILESKYSERLPLLESLLDRERLER